MTTACSIRQPPPPTMRRRLRMSRDRGWLVRLHGIDCSRLTGTVMRVDLRALRCLLATPGSLCPEQEVDLDSVCDVQAVGAALMRDGRLLARFAVIAPWRGGAAGPDALVADLLSGEAALGNAGTLLLDDGSRRTCRVTAMEHPRCRIELD